ncbi:MAG: hypothetical protein PHT94_04855 [Candidatus Nanoarchaeia archaeon]|nr:hypothetical protein [Candidatus Nanoarchaeia archaeon]
METQKDKILTIISIVILFVTSLINWTIYSWLILVAIILIILAWYFRNKK